MSRGPLALARSAAVASTVAALVAGCGATDPEVVASEPAGPRPPTADVAALEIRERGVDRFTSCPPPGELGQHWIPDPFPWSPSDRDGGPTPKFGVLASRDGRTPTELAVEATHADFRRCFGLGLLRDATQAGRASRVAIVLRVGPSGRVAKVEEYAACALLPEAIACMKAAASRLRFPPPEGGSDTITIPAVFLPRSGVRRAQPTPDDAYTAAAYVTIESSRPLLHACVDEARRALRPVSASGTFTLSITRDGHVASAHVDPWAGDKALLACAAHALQRLTFARPPSGRGTVIARLKFNPRQAARSAW